MTFFQYLLVYLIQMCFGYNVNYIVTDDNDNKSSHKPTNFTSGLESSQLFYSFVDHLWSHYMNPVDDKPQQHIVQYCFLKHSTVQLGRVDEFYFWFYGPIDWIPYAFLIHHLLKWIIFSAPKIKQVQNQLCEIKEDCLVVTNIIAEL